MSGEHGKSRKPIWLNWTVVALLLVGGFTLSACQQLSGGKSPEQLDNQPAQSDQKQSDQQSQDKQPTKAEQKPSDSQLKKNSSAQSPQKNSSQKQDKVQDTQADDDPD